MSEFIFRGKITLDGVEFFITAKTLAEARKKAVLGHYDGYEAVLAEAVDWTIDHNSGEENI